MNTEMIQIDDVEYELSSYGASKTYPMAKKAIAIIGSALSVGTGEQSIDMEKLCESIGSERFVEIENFIFGSVTASVNGKASKIAATMDFDNHFAERMDHITQLIFKGAIFHFGRFFPNGGEFLKNINLDKIQALMAESGKQT